MLNGLLDGNEDFFATKIIKIFTGEQGIREYEIQLRAYGFLQQATDVASIPKPILIRRQHLSEAYATYLNSFGASLKDEAEIIIMDYVDGKDLATLIYEHILKKHNFDEHSLENMPFEDKNSKVAEILNFEFPTEKGGFGDLISHRDNLRKLMAYLKKTNFQIQPEILDKIEKAIEILEKNGIFHNDLHERNIIITPNGQPFIIDFGRSVSNKSEQTSEDIAIVHRFRQKEEKNDFEEWENRVRKLDIKKHKEMIEKLSTFLSAKNATAIANILSASTTFESDFYNQIAMMIHIIRSNKNKKTKKLMLDTMIESIKKLREKKLEQYLQNKLKVIDRFIDTKLKPTIQ